MIFFWVLATFIAFIFEGINDNKNILNYNAKQISFLHAEGGNYPESSFSSPSTEAVNSESEELSPLSSWFGQKLECNSSDYLQNSGIDHNLTSKDSCTKSNLKELLKELKTSLKTFILNTMQVQHYEKNKSTGKYVTSSFDEYLTKKKQEISELNANIQLLLDRIFKCLMLLRLDKYSRKKLVANSVNCNSSTLLFFTSLHALSKKVLVVLEKLLNKFNKKYKSSTKNITATFDHSALSASVQTTKALIAEQNKISGKTKDKKKKCKMYLVYSSTDISTLL